MKAERRLLLLGSLVLALSSACRGIPELDDRSKLADVTIAEPKYDDYTSYKFALDQQDGSFRLPLFETMKGEKNQISVRVPVGTYKLTLDYFKDKVAVLSTMFCKESDRNDLQTFKAGPNEVYLNVCNAKGEVMESSVIIKPIFTPTPDSPKPTPTPAPTVTPKPTPGPSPVPKPNESFGIQDGKLMDPLGKAFVIRGINMPFAYYFDQSFTAMDQVKAHGFNSVRIVWCATNYEDPDRRCQQKDFRSAADLDRVITRLSDLKLVTIFNLQNATGQNSVNALNAMADYLLKPEIMAVLNKHKRNVIINIANEWLGVWDKNRNWVDGYKAVIQRLRSSGYGHVLVVDARGYGQDFSSIAEDSKELMDFDKNLLFSSHMYAVYKTDQDVQNALNVVRTRKIPFMIGEFGCSHYDDKSKVNNAVACETIMREAANAGYPIGTMAWSYSGNRSEEADLDVFRAADWRTLSAYGERVVNGTYGVKATAKTACSLDAAQAHCR